MSGRTTSAWVIARGTVAHERCLGSCSGQAGRERAQPPLSGGSWCSCISLPRAAPQPRNCRSRTMPRSPLSFLKRRKKDTSTSSDNPSTTDEVIEGSGLMALTPQSSSAMAATPSLIPLVDPHGENLQVYWSARSLCIPYTPPAIQQMAHSASRRYQTQPTQTWSRHSRPRTINGKLIL